MQAEMPSFVPKINLTVLSYPGKITENVTLAVNSSSSASKYTPINAFALHRSRAPWPFISKVGTQGIPRIVPKNFKGDVLRYTVAVYPKKLPHGALTIVCQSMQLRYTEASWPFISNVGAVRHWIISWHVIQIKWPFDP